MVQGIGEGDEGDCGGGGGELSGSGEVERNREVGEWKMDNFNICLIER